jgi:hypothetical protein
MVLPELHFQSFGDPKSPAVVCVDGKRGRVER